MTTEFDLITKEDILEILRMPEEQYRAVLAPKAKAVHIETNGNTLTATAMLGFSNICRNRCLYCGMRAGNAIPRYRMEIPRILELFASAHKQGLRRAFLVSGEDPGFAFDSLLKLVASLKDQGMEWISLACGEFEKSQYSELHDAGADEYVLKFEMGQEEVFNRLNPSTDFRKRMAAIRSIRELDIPLASGDIVGYPGQTEEMLAEDLLLMRDLGISWAPIIPYMPAKNTPLALEGGPGRLDWMWKVISVLRLMMPKVNITAQQPGKDPAEGLASREGNLAALNAGANFLYADLLPASQAEDFRVIDHRVTLGLDHIREMADVSGMVLTF